MGLLCAYIQVLPTLKHYLVTSQTLPIALPIPTIKDTGKYSHWEKKLKPWKSVIISATEEQVLASRLPITLLCHGQSIFKLFFFFNQKTIYAYKRSWYRGSGRGMLLNLLGLSLEPYVEIHWKSESTLMHVLGIKQAADYSRSVGLWAWSGLPPGLPQYHIRGGLHPGGLSHRCYR